MENQLLLTGNVLNLEDIKLVSFNKKTVAISSVALNVAASAHTLLLKLLEKGQSIYGANHGVGWNKDKRISSHQQLKFNRSLLLSHSVALPPYATKEEVRAMMLIRLNKALLGHTGLSVKVLLAYRDFINFDIIPLVPKTGSIGEGDISTLSYIGSAILGEGSVVFRGQKMSSREALQMCGLSPIIPDPKDGLGMVSTNAHGEAICAMLLLEAKQFLDWASLSYCLALEAFSGNVHPLREDVNSCRRQNGQIESAKQFREHLLGSYLFNPGLGRALQDPLSYRCAAAIHGSCLDVLTYIQDIFEKQINASDDNPCLLINSQEIAGSANFETTTLALSIEMLASAFAHLSRMIVFRIIHLGDPAFTGLNRFLSPDPENCIAFGTIQKTVSALDIEIRHLALPSSAEFIPLAGQIEDHASNLPFVAEKSRKIIDILYSLLSIEMIHAAQAVDLRKVSSKLGKDTSLLYFLIRNMVPFYNVDHCMCDELLQLKQKIMETGCSIHTLAD